MAKECEREDMSANISERMKSLKKMREKLVFDAYYLQAENYYKSGKMARYKPRVDLFLDHCSRLAEKDLYRSLWDMTPTPLGHAKPYSFKEIEDIAFKFDLCKLICRTKNGRMFSCQTDVAITIKTWDFFWPASNAYADHPSRFCNELEILTDDNPHPCLMKLKGFCFQNILAVIMKVATQLASLFTWLNAKRLAIGRMEPSAIMIDKEFNIKVMDFSFLVCVRDIPHNILPDAPEADNVTQTLKDDVYAFGILLLRLITNNKNIEGPYHCWILEKLQDGKGSIVDKSVMLTCDSVLSCGITKLETQCLDEDPNARPDMKNVFDRLTNLVEVNDLVKRHFRAEIHSPGYKCELVGNSFWIHISKTNVGKRQVRDVFSERPGEQFRQTRMISIATLALAVGGLGFLLFKKH
ncbi:hypothetical protein KY290_009260 [Solanum tuberosum]|uniref:Protein kinase domain-containing protein n=1 Tax=Solanum tuberosum TaxID=4113 RepID=A0ABQ7WAW9_SOLTU|nr:hypothetical protein KY290_009260 [Solanum tuberosum]